LELSTYTRGYCYFVFSTIRRSWAIVKRDSVPYGGTVLMSVVGSRIAYVPIPEEEKQRTGAVEGQDVHFMLLTRLPYQSTDLKPHMASNW
jgi:hypothetical protein